MRRRTKKNVRRHAPKHREFEGDDDWGGPEAELAPEPEPDQDEGAPVAAALPKAPVDEALEAFLANYTPPRPPKSRVLTWAVAISAALHISTVTLFSIVIYFPREDVQYYDFRIVPLSTMGLAQSEGVAPSGLGGDLRLGGALDSVLGNDSLREQYATRPLVQLPTLETATLDRLRLRQTTVEERAAYDRLFGAAAQQDSWARFGQGIGRIRDAFAGVEGAVSPTSPGALGIGAAPSEMTVLRPADGFEATVSWDSAASGRALLFSPPMRSLYELADELSARGVEVVFEVNATGRVTNVWSPTIDDSGIVDDIQATVLQYRFEPAGQGQRDTASGVIRVRRAESGS